MHQRHQIHRTHRTHRTYQALQASVLVGGWDPKPFQSLPPARPVDSVARRRRRDQKPPHLETATSLWTEDSVVPYRLHGGGTKLRLVRDVGAVSAPSQPRPNHCTLRPETPMALADDFQAAQNNVKGLSSRPSNDTLLDLYALYKQGTDGDCNGKRPGMLDVKGRAKFDAWAKKKGTGKEAAQQAYVDLVSRLLKA